MEQNVDVVELVSTLLDTGKYKEALAVHQHEKYSESFKDNCWDLISVIVGKIQNDTVIVKPSLHGACEELLNIVVKKSAPEEALLEFIEQIEVAKNDAQFSIILTPLQQLLRKLISKRGRSLEWCLNSITTYIEGIPTLDHPLEGKERLLLDSDDNVRRVARIYSLLPAFYSPFITELNIVNNVRTKQIIVAFLISLLGKPIIYIDMDPEANTQSETRQCCTTTINDICGLEKDVLKFLQFLEVCHRENQKSKSRPRNDESEEVSPYEHQQKINMTTLSGLFYIILSGHFSIPDEAVPQVYSAEYLVHTSMLAVLHLLNFAEFGPLAKGIALFKALLNRLSNELSHTVLLSSIHFDVCKSLVNVAIYSNYETIRKSAVYLIGAHIFKFHYNGRCFLIKFLLDMANHSGMIGYAITLYKNSIDKAFKSQSLPKCFTGTQLTCMVTKICHLPHGAESDLVELADQIITSLNFLRYLALKDTENLTGIRDSFSYIESDYLAKLRTALNMSKAHYEVKLKDIEEGRHPEGHSVSINVGGNVLDNIPTENKKEIICSALNAFHLIEGLVARLSECININKMQGLTMEESVRHCRRTLRPLASVVNSTQRVVRNYSQTIEAEPKLTVVNIEQEDLQYEDNVKTRILERALEFVPKSGWSLDSLAAGAEAVGYPGVTHGLFPNGGGDLVHYFNVKCNERLVEEMKSWPKEDMKESKVPMKFVEKAIVTRLFMIEPYKNTWPKAMAIQALPNNVPNCLATLLSLVDDICYHSGDRSVDFNWYLRRVGLAGIYKASELFYIADSSANNTATSSFVSSRIRDAALIQAALNLNPVSAAAAAPQTLSAAFVTAKNMLGINTLK